MMIQGEHEGVEGFCESLEESFCGLSLNQKHLAEFYKHVIGLYFNTVKSDVLDSYINKYRFKLAEYLFTERDYKQALALFKTIIRTNTDKNLDHEMTECCCVYACLIVILCKRPEYIHKHISEIREMTSDFEESVQYLTVQRIIESYLNKNYQGIEDAVWLCLI
ncbi:hypothetical protein RF11_04956 [Thelohanellus kitauei]|uniref:Uncharacterized protein n=1 Tax=Thelohanellus kitauei TaxID=669202 RepID=A0A0C2J2I7_THEKT|nr:hypothetical protein RF11_04956 [Thelohanellus kitauei]